MIRWGFDLDPRTRINDVIENITYKVPNQTNDHPSTLLYYSLRYSGRRRCPCSNAPPLPHHLLFRMPRLLASAVACSPRLAQPTTHKRPLQTLIPMVMGRRRAILVLVGSSAVAQQAARTSTRPATSNTDAAALGQVLLPGLDPRLERDAGAGTDYLMLPGPR